MLIDHILGTRAAPGQQLEFGTVREECRRTDQQVDELGRVPSAREPCRLCVFDNSGQPIEERARVAIEQPLKPRSGSRGIVRHQPNELGMFGAEAEKFSRKQAHALGDFDALETAQTVLESVKNMIENGLPEPKLVAEVMGDQLLIDSGSCTDLSEASGAEADLGERIESSREDSLARLGGVFA